MNIGTKAAILVFFGAASAPAPVVRPHFVDVVSRVKFSYRSNNDPQARKYFQQPICGGIGILDYDGDGLVDIFFSNGAELPGLTKSDSSFYSCLLRNKGGGAFEDVTAKAGLSGQQIGFSYGVAVGDYDNDGWPDLFVANTGKNTLYHNDGNGAFVDVTDRSGLGAKTADILSVQAAWFDYDNDGLLDLVVSNYTEWTPGKDRRCTARRRGGVLQPSNLHKRSAAALSQSGRRKVRGCDAELRIRSRARQGNGNRHCRFQR